MQISIIGTGYVGLVTGACLAEMGNNVLCIDVDAEKINGLRQGRIPIHEPHLAEMVSRNTQAGRLAFTSDPAQGAAFGAIQMIAVGTPPGEDGSADLNYVLTAARNIGRHMRQDSLIVTKSTVPVGTAREVARVIDHELQRRSAGYKFSVVSNPEFLKEGSAVKDFMSPDRIIIGTEDPIAIKTLTALYAPFQRNHGRIILMDTLSAELCKYASNAMLATRISFMNELSCLAECLGADIEQVRQGMGADPRIGYDFLYPGCGFGGSCFPKDIRALEQMAKAVDLEMPLINAVTAINTRQKQRLLEKIMCRLGSDLTDKRIAIWGLAFKPNTDDMREAPSRIIIDALCRMGASVVAYDPVAAATAANIYASQPQFQLAAHAMLALEDADALVILTEWQSFRSPDFRAIRQALRSPIIFDGRNLYDPLIMQEHNFEYYSIGRKPLLSDLAPAPSEARGIPN